MRARYLGDHCPSLTVVGSQLLDPAWKLEAVAVRCLPSGYEGRTVWRRRWGETSPADNLAAGRELLARTDSLYSGVPRRPRARLDLPAAGGSAETPVGDAILLVGDLPHEWLSDAAVLPRPTGLPRPRR